MKTILIFVILALTPYSVFAAKLAEGEVDGAIKIHDGKFTPTIFIIKSMENGDDPNYKIEMIHDERFYKFKKLTLDDQDNMNFYLDTGQEYKCKLSLDEKAKDDITDCKSRAGYCGECIQADDEERQKLIVINLKPAPTEPETALQDDAEQ